MNKVYIVIDDDNVNVDSFESLNTALSHMSDLVSEDNADPKDLKLYVAYQLDVTPPGKMALADTEKNKQILDHVTTTTNDDDGDELED